MILYLKKVQELLKKFVLVQVRHIPRAENSRVDTLAKLAKTSQEDLSRLTPVEHLAEPSIDLMDVEVSPVTSEPRWMDPIWDYLIGGLPPSDQKEATKLITRSARFTVHKGCLYKQGFFAPILKCIEGRDADYVLKEVHEGVCGNHIGARELAGKVLRQGYYLPIMLRDAIDLVRKCKICQEHVKISHLPSEPLMSVTSPRPFQQWVWTYWDLCPLGRPMQIHHRCSKLLHQMGRGRTFGYYHRIKDTQFCVAFHNMQV